VRDLVVEAIFGLRSVVVVGYCYGDGGVAAVFELGVRGHFETCGEARFAGELYASGAPAAAEGAGGTVADGWG
jgi:hypothetical protein